MQKINIYTIFVYYLFINNISAEIYWENSDEGPFGTVQGNYHYSHKYSSSAMGSEPSVATYSTKYGSGPVTTYKTFTPMGRQEYTYEGPFGTEQGNYHYSQKYSSSAMGNEPAIATYSTKYGSGPVTTHETYTTVGRQVLPSSHRSYTTVGDRILPSPHNTYATKILPSNFASGTSLSNNPYRNRLSETRSFDNRVLDNLNSFENHLPLDLKNQNNFASGTSLSNNPYRNRLSETRSFNQNNFASGTLSSNGNPMDYNPYRNRISEKTFDNKVLDNQKEKVSTQTEPNNIRPSDEDNQNNIASGTLRSNRNPKDYNPYRNGISENNFNSKVLDNQKEKVSTQTEPNNIRPADEEDKIVVVQTNITRSLSPDEI